MSTETTTALAELLAEQHRARKLAEATVREQDAQARVFQSRISGMEARCDEYHAERATLRARVSELEAENHRLRHERAVDSDRMEWIAEEMRRLRLGSFPGVCDKGQPYADRLRAYVDEQSAKETGHI